MPWEMGVQDTLGAWWWYIYHYVIDSQRVAKEEKERNL